MVYGSTPRSINRVTADGASFVQRREHEVTGLTRPHGGLRGLAVANLTEHDDVGVLAQRRAQRGGERQVRLVVDLRLVHGGESISIGSSSVMMFISSECRDDSADARVVVFPLPVGPTTRIMPW